MSNSSIRQDHTPAFSPSPQLCVYCPAVRLFIAIAAALVLTGGCKGDGGKGKKAPPVNPGARSDAATGAPQSDEDRLLSLARCKVNARGIDRKCPAWRQFRRGESTRDRIRARSRAEVGLRFLNNPSAAVRARAFVWATRAEGVAPADRAKVLGALRKEKNPGALAVMVTHASLALHGPDMAELWLSLADHPGEVIRQRVVVALTDRRMAGTRGTLEKALAMVEKDSSLLVRRAGCARLGDRQDERALPLLARMTSGARVEPALYESCFFGLIGMWLSTSAPVSPNRKAYELTLARLRAKPRSARVPPRAAVRRMRHAARPVFTKRAPSWYRAADVIAALFSVASDRNARPITRGAAISAMESLGARRAQLASVGKSIGDTPDEKLVRDALDRALARMGKPRQPKHPMPKKKATVPKE
jgi:hypothetical protein